MIFIGINGSNYCGKNETITEELVRVNLIEAFQIFRDTDLNESFFYVKVNNSWCSISKENYFKVKKYLTDDE